MRSGFQDNSQRNGPWPSYVVLGNAGSVLRLPAKGTIEGVTYDTNSSVTVSPTWLNACNET